LREPGTEAIAPANIRAIAEDHDVFHFERAVPVVGQVLPKRQVVGAPDDSRAVGSRLDTFHDAGCDGSGFGRTLRAGAFSSVHAVY
jgi:hypothetical protein